MEMRYGKCTISIQEIHDGLLSDPSHFRYSGKHPTKPDGTWQIYKIHTAKVENSNIATVDFLPIEVSHRFRDLQPNLP